MKDALVIVHATPKLIDRLWKHETPRIMKEIRERVALYSLKWKPIYYTPFWWYDEVPHYISSVWKVVIADWIWQAPIQHTSLSHQGSAVKMALVKLGINKVELWWLYKNACVTWTSKVITMDDHHKLKELSASMGLNRHEAKALSTPMITSINPDICNKHVEDYFVWLRK